MGHQRGDVCGDLLLFRLLLRTKFIYIVDLGTRTERKGYLLVGLFLLSDDILEDGVVVSTLKLYLD